ncbi:MAG: 30S ribosomal protein S9 [Candidatus Aenigmatarchaeota archaeon]|nr:MAG: 30S ribosomal protein S9 [Candidatus Aenigmarchaeota archaeon]
MVVGKRKLAVAKAIVRKGKGMVRFNRAPLEALESEMLRLMLEEPLILAGDVAKGVDIDITVKGGGKVGQVEAARQSIALGLVEFTGDAKLKEIFENYDKNLLKVDWRRTEPHKPSRSSQGPRRHKQRSKR